MRSIIAFLLFLLSLGGVPAQAATVPVTPMQNAVSGVIQSKMSTRGFAANDPRYAGTLINAGSALAGVAAGAAVVTLAGVTAPAWITVGVSSLVGAAVTLAVDGVVNWLFNSDGTVTSSGSSSSGGGAGYDGRTDWADTAYTPVIIKLNMNGWPLQPGEQDSGKWVSPGDLGIPFSMWWCGVEGHGPCELHTITSAIMNGAPPPNSGGSAPVTYAQPTDAVANLPPEEKAKPANPAIIAAIANQAWQQAASQPGYNGLPYDAAQPITAADAAAWQAAHSSSWPSVGDMVSPQPAPSGGTASTPFELPTSTSPVSSVDPATQTNTGTNPAADNPLTNLGTDPGIGFPTLETPPSAAQILDPIFNIFPSLRTYSVPAHSAVCPTASLNLFGQTQSFSAHCSLLEDVRPILAAIMMAVWSFVALRVTLSA